MEHRTLFPASFQSFFMCVLWIEEKTAKDTDENEKKFEGRKESVPRSQAQTDSIECSLGRGRGL